jgi:hypothetical protein
MSRSGSMRPVKVQGTWPAAIPQLPQKAGNFFHSCMFLASAFRGLSSIYAMYRGRGLVLGVVFGLGLVLGLETGFVSSPLLFAARKHNPICWNTVQLRLRVGFRLDRSSLIPEKTRLEANRFRRTASPREMLANVITLFASSYWLEINLALSSSAVPSL